MKMSHDTDHTIQADMLKHPGETAVPIFRQSVYRWIILLLYGITTFTSFMIGISLFTISDAVCKFYSVESYVLLWSANALLFSQLLMCIPMTFLPSRYGLRWCLVLGAAISALDGAIMICGAQRNGFAFFVVGQSANSIANSILRQLAPEIACVWFGDREQALATGIGIMLSISGAAFGFLQPALLLKDKSVDNIHDVKDTITLIIYSQSSLAVLMFFIDLVWFKDRPQRPPSLAQSLRPGPGEIDFTAFKGSLRKLWRNSSYHVVLQSFALTSCATDVVSLFQNELIAGYIPGNDASVGWMGFTAIMVALIGNVLFSLIIDRTKAFKRVCVGTLALSIPTFVLNTLAVTYWRSIQLAFTFFVLSAFFFIPAGPILVDTMSEITYPEPSSTSYTIAMGVSRVYSIALTFGSGWLIKQHRGDVYCWMLVGIACLCLLLTCVLKVSPKRTHCNDVDSTDSVTT